MSVVEHLQPPTLDIEAACRLARSLVSLITQNETVPLAEASGRVAARTVFASQALPATDRSAMDGFAVNTTVLGTGGSIPIAGVIAAGAPKTRLPEGAALRIFTGAVVPGGADAVVPVEDCIETGARVSFCRAAVSGENIRRTGDEQPLGGVLLREGARIQPHHVGLLAANGLERLNVIRRPRMGILSTGDELKGGAAGPESIPDSNRPMLMALARVAGADVEDLGILPDDRDAIVQRLTSLRDRYDLVITSGAVSMGGRDHLRPALQQAGGRIEGWRVALKPGKPIMFGRIGQTVLTGLPGNPFSAFVGFHLFVAAQIAQMRQAPVTPFFHASARAGFDWTRKVGRAEVFAVRLSHDEGEPQLLRLGGNSATLFPLAEADGLAIVPADADRITFRDGLLWHPFADRA